MANGFPNISYCTLLELRESVFSGDTVIYRPLRIRGYADILLPLRRSRYWVNAILRPSLRAIRRRRIETI